MLSTRYRTGIRSPTYPTRDRYQRTNLTTRTALKLLRIKLADADLTGIVDTVDELNILVLQLQ
jgi:hypothetical protein